MFLTNREHHTEKSYMEDKYKLSNNKNLSEISFLSTQVSSFREVAVLFAIIEHSIYTRNRQSIQKMKISSTQHMYRLSNNHKASGSCQKYLQVLTKISICLSKDYQESIELLKLLYESKEEMMNYFVLLSEEMGQDCVKKLSLEFQVKIILFEVSLIDKKKELLILSQYNEKDVKNCRKEIKIGHFGNQYHILYDIHIQYLDFLSKNMYQSQQNLQKIHTMTTNIKLNENQYARKIEKKNQQIQKLELELIEVQDQNLKMNVQYQQLLRKYQLSLESQRAQQIIISSLERQVSQLVQQCKTKAVKFNVEGDHTQEKQKAEAQKQKDSTKKKKFFKIVTDQLKKEQETKHDTLPNNSNLKKTAKQKFKNFKIVQYLPIKKQKEPDTLQTIFKKAPTGEMTKVNAITFSLHLNQTLCQTCEDVMIPYSIFDCNHLCCSNCLVRYIEVCLLDGGIPLCISDGCGKECNIYTTILFLTFKERRDLCEKLQETLYRIQNKHRLFSCPECHQTFEIDQDVKFVEHCDRSYCRGCGEAHSAQTKCDQARFDSLLDQLTYPTVCPSCHTLYDKDDHCDHVVCPNCKEDNPIGFCARCAVLRSPTMAHDTSYHRTDCSFYFPNPEPLRRQPKCLECNKLDGGQHCLRPSQTLKQFVLDIYGQSFTAKFYQKRVEYLGKKDMN